MSDVNVSAEVERRRYYNPILDVSIERMTDKHRIAADEDSYDDGGPLNEPDLAHPANLVSSLCTDGKHRPVLDLDVAACLVSSSSPGNSHLYINGVALDWEPYVELLQALAKAGLLEQRYVDHSIARGQTLVRMPGYPRHFPRRAT